ncbi:DUF2357 domain-containing protein [Desulfatibacillum aliphaticivorans]|uniref:DUF2357 domain-containing protein n=1 Tax=Desulfatibacillum aliphaticivorans TaxID=218208 RepID=UPI000423F92A|nr:DUF2357 domain-containing protein [Desulfatibacillum aliphaticivorans]
MSETVEAQIHLWPWSFGMQDNQETTALRTDAAIFPFYGSPVVSLSSRASLFLSSRHERFIPLGPAFQTLSGMCRLYEVPHGVISNSCKNLSKQGGDVIIYTEGDRKKIRLKPEGAQPRLESMDDGEFKESKLSRTVLAWSQFFDDLIEETKGTQRENKLPWARIEDIIGDIKKDAEEPRKALIVDIAERMHSRLPVFVHAARKILLRERRMQPAGRVTEIDNSCLKWIVRQPGETVPQKVAANHQRMLSVARNESFDTLENRVLKDFLFRCAKESHRYLNIEVDPAKHSQSTRAKRVNSFKNLSSKLHQVEHLKSVSEPEVGLRPNYVLQNDYRYKQIWKQYLRLLRREDEEDRLWDWQSRTWSDLVRFFVNFALYDLSRKINDKKGEIVVELESTSVIHLLKEQHLGCRVKEGAEPGPFIVGRHGDAKDKAFALEVVHSAQAGEHMVTNLLGRLGAHLYLVLHPLRGGSPAVVAVWAVHTAGSSSHPGWEAIGRSAGKALKMHSHIRNELRDLNSPTLHGFVVASDIDFPDAELHPGMGDGVHVVQAAADQRCWADALAGISAIIEDILGAII